MSISEHVAVGHFDSFGDSCYFIMDDLYRFGLKESTFCVICSFFIVSSVTVDGISVSYMSEHR